MSHQYIIETKDLTKKYKNNTIVDSVNININPGEIYGLLGKNGAGKTTTMSLLLKLVEKTKGEIRIFSKNIDKSSTSIYQNIGSILETPGFYENLTGEENLQLFSKLYGISDKNKIHELLELLNLNEDRNKLYKNYSLGMKQRLGIALSLLKNPSLLILDEPINGLDPIGIQEIRNLLTRLAKEHGIAVLISSHILSEIEHIADRIGIMNNGVLIEEISMSNLSSHLKSHVLFQLSDAFKAGEILSKMNLKEDSDYRILSETDMCLYTHLDSRAEINKMFIEGNVDVYGINLIRENLEEYFIDLVEN